MGGGGERMEEKVQGLRSIISRYKIDGNVKNSTGNRETKELICTTNEHELRGVDCWREEGYQVEEGKGGKLRQL